MISLAKTFGQSAAFVGIVAGFWHIRWYAGVVLLASGLLAIGIYSAGYQGVERR